MSTMVSRATSRWMSTAHWWVRGVLRLGSTTVLEAAGHAAGWVGVLGGAVGGLSAGRLASRPPFWPKSVLMAAYAFPGRLGRMVDATTKSLMAAYAFPGR